MKKCLSCLLAVATLATPLVFKTKASQKVNFIINSEKLLVSVDNDIPPVIIPPFKLPRKKIVPLNSTTEYVIIADKLSQISTTR